MIKKIIYNWVQVGDIESGMGGDYEAAEVGKVDTNRNVEVLHISERKPKLNNDKLYYDILYVDDIVIRVFNPNTVLATKS